MSKISVILTSYNHEKYLREAIDSVLNQTFRNFELIIWDDASGDDSWKIINSYKDDRIKAYQNKQNMGGGNVNRALDVVTGEYIAIHHSDDVWETDKLEIQVAFLETHGEIGAVFSNALAIEEDGRALANENHFYFSIFDQPNRTRHEWLRFFFIQGNALCHPSVLIRKECYEKCGRYRYGLVQLGDLDMWIRLCLKYEIHVFPEKLVRFRVRNKEANASGNRPEARIRLAYESYKLLQNYRRLERFDDLVKIFPAAGKFDRGEETDIDFALAMVGLEEKPFPSAALFCQDILFEILSDPKRASRIHQLYHFNHKSFVALTATHDAFSREEISMQSAAIAERDGEIARLKQMVAVRDGEIAGLKRGLTERDEKLDKSYQMRDYLLSRLLSFPSGSRLFKIFKLMNRIPNRLFAFRNRSRVAASDLFDANYYIASNPDVEKSGVDPVNHYLMNGWRELRNPSLNFNTRQYLIEYLDVAVAGINPLVHYLRAGQMEGRSVPGANGLPELSPRRKSSEMNQDESFRPPSAGCSPGEEKPHIISLTDDYCFVVPFDYAMEKAAAPPALAVICHMYYPEMMEEFKSYLLNIPFPFDWFITTDSEQKKTAIMKRLPDWSKGRVEIRIAPNRGRDIAPKLISCRDIYDRYEYFLHIHSKKSHYGGEWADWRAYLLKTLLGSEKIVESVFEAFNSDSKLGIVAPEHFTPASKYLGWGKNFSVAKPLASDMGIEISLNGKMDFPSGSMFWGRTAAIKPLLDRKLTIEDFPPETQQTDSTLAHAVERLYFFVCEKAGYRWIKMIHPVLLIRTERLLFVKSKTSLAELIKYAQYGLLKLSKEDLQWLSKFRKSLLKYVGGINQSKRIAHAKSNLRMLDFHQFSEELDKHMSKQESMIDFDENFYLAANPDIAEAVTKHGLPCGYIHYCNAGQFENRTYSDRQLMRRFSIKPNYPVGFLAPVGDLPIQPLSERISLAHLPQSPHHILLILLSHLREDIFFAGYAAFFNDYRPVFDRFERVIIAVEHADFNENIARRYSERLEVIHMPTINALKYKPDLIIAFNAHLACAAHRLLPDGRDRVVYYCQEYESGFFPYSSDYIIGVQAIANSRNLVLSTELLRKFLIHRGLVGDQRVFVTCPKIEVFDVPAEKTKRLFFYYRPESFNRRNMAYEVMRAVREFCCRHTGYEIYMCGSVATAYSYRINETQIYIVNKLPKEDYVKVISSCDVVVSMIYSAHPGVIAFQAAASGIPTVTNIFENRDASLLKNISDNIIPYDPIRDNLVDVIEQALTMDKGKPSFNEALYAGNQQESLVDFHEHILRRLRPELE